jgi:outer membrane protein TolC
MTLQEAVQLAFKHNHDIRIASYTVEEKQHAKEIAKSSYLPPYETTAAFWHLTDTQLIEINAGSLGVAGGTGPQMSARSLLFRRGRGIWGYFAWTSDSTLHPSDFVSI